MLHLSFAGMILRFVLGGGAVLASAFIAKKLGGKIGGIFAAFPAVYLAALLTIRIDASGNELIERSVALSQGALVGMAINIICAISVGYLCVKQGWKRGLFSSMCGWFFVSLMIAYFSTHA